MKKETVAHFDLVKMQNRKIIRNLLRLESPLSIAQVAEKIGLSYPTASGLLKELTAAGEVKVSKQQNIAGGRPGICYELNAEYQYGLIIYFDDWSLKGEIYDAFGNLKKDYLWEKIDAEIEAEDVTNYIREVKEEFPTLSAVAIGIPGAVHENKIMHLPKFPKLLGERLSEYLREELDIEVFIENDINAIAFAEVGAWENFAHIVYVDPAECIGVGIVMQGQIVKGGQGFAGEMEYLCDDMKNREDVFVTSIMSLICVLNLEDILVSGAFCTEENIKKVKDRLCTLLPRDIIPNIHIIKETKGLYAKGLLRKILLVWAERI